MIATASQLLHAHCGSPPAKSCGPLPASNACRVCGGPARRGMDAEECAPTWLMQAAIRAPLSPWICEACVYVTARFSPVPGKPAAPGKSEGPRFSNLSHLYEETPAGVWYRAASKGEKPAIRKFLARPKIGRWFAAIADSGQKHVLSWTPVNPGPSSGGRVRFEEQDLTLPASLTLVDEIASLLTAGATKEEIGRGDYGMGAWTRCPAEIQRFEEVHAPDRHGAWWSLALWLAQRDEEQVQARMAAEAARRSRAAGSGSRRRGRGDGGAAGPGAERVSGDAGSERAPALGPTPGPDEGSGQVVDERRGVGDEPVPQPPVAGPRQLSLAVDLRADDRGGGAGRHPRMARSRRA